MTDGLDIIIVGAGIAGLACARALREKHRVRVIEQTRLKSELGAAIHLGPNAARLILPWGVDLDESPRTNVVRELDSDLNLIKATAIDAEKQFGAPWLLNHRVTLHKELLRVATTAVEGIPGRPAELITGARVIEVDPEHATLMLEDGTQLNADVIIGADGIKSVVRSAVVGDSFSAKPSGHSAYRCLISADKIKHDEELSWLMSPTGVTLMLGVDRRVVAYTCAYKGEKLINIVAAVPDNELGHLSEESWNAPASVESLVNAFSNFSPAIKRLLSYATDVSCWQLRDQDPLESWVKGRLIIIGDAAHPMLPHMGQGGSQAIEDADMLGFLLRDLNSTNSDQDIHAALQEVFRLRWERASMCQETSRAQAMGPREAGETVKITAVNPLKLSSLLYSYTGAEDWAANNPVVKPSSPPTMPVATPTPTPTAAALSAVVST